MRTTNKKPAGGAGFLRWSGYMIGYTPIIPAYPRKDNPHLRDLRRQAANFMDLAEAAQNWPLHRKHFQVYCAVVDAETGIGGGE